MFGCRLKEARKAKGFTLDELARIYNERFGGGLNKGTLSKYENGKQVPMVTVVRDLSSILEVSTDYLLGKTNSTILNGRVGAAYKGPPLADGDNLAFIIENLTFERRKIIEDLIILTWKRQKEEEKLLIKT